MEREGREMRKERRGGEMRRGIIVALFLGISFLLISCGNGGPVPKEGQAATADGTILNLKEIGDNIRGVVDFVINIEEVKSLISSIDELAKGIGQKINGSGITADSTHQNKNNTLIAGVYEIALAIVTKVNGLKVGESFKDKDLESKIETVKTKAGEFKAKLLQQNGDLGSGSGTTEAHAQQALDRSKGSKGTHGSKELSELHEAVTALMSTAKEVLGKVIAPAKEISPAAN